MDVRYFNGLLNIDRSTLGQYLGKEYAHLGGNLADDATTRLCHCGYDDNGMGEAVSEQVLM